jgi:hypothetical protein
MCDQCGGHNRSFSAWAPGATITPMESARIVRMKDELKSVVFVVGEGERRRGSQLIGKLVDARTFEYALKEHADGVEIECPECRAAAKHRRGARRDRQQRRGQPSFYADHKSGCGLASQRDDAWDSDREATHYVLVTNGADRGVASEGLDSQGRRMLRIGLQELLATARAPIETGDAITYNGATERLREFVVAAAHLGEAEVGAVRAVWAPITSIKPAQKGVFVNLASVGVLVSHELVSANPALFEDALNKPSLVIGRVEQGRRGYFVRLYDVNHMHVARPPKRPATSAPEVPKPAPTSDSWPACTKPPVLGPVAPPAPQPAHFESGRALASPSKDLAVRPAQPTALKQRGNPLTRVLEWLDERWQQLASLLKL